MTVSERAANLRARTQVADGHPGKPTTSENAPTGPALRLVTGPTQAAVPETTPREDHAASTGAAVAEALHQHPVIATHPPTTASAAADIWPDRGDVRHGIAGQIASAAAGIAQTLGLGLCWATAHVLFATKTAAAITVLTFAVALAVIAVASHT